MQKTRKSNLEAAELGGAIRQRRKFLGLTLEKIAKEVQVDVGQLSRFERGEFKYSSKNLQKTLSYLQISTDEKSEVADRLIRKFAELLVRSERHKAAATALVEALQELR
ncbi:helix-turn-helix domain-containing protein [Paraburkholderia hospita]|uniref:helix-turn-helix domain-containing protein n=1 Tax=Paraburkholderia hospita TaxID=169430 RepID=UPI000F0A8E47|nr:helix-turn-helix transcriptional regulator [Paraburkholderia hospita]